MKFTRPALLLASASVALLLVGAGFGLRAGAAEGAYRQVVQFSEVLSLVLDNYVDPVDEERLLSGAYEGLMGGLDANGAYLTADEVKDWKAGQADGADPGCDVLKAGTTLQIVALEAGAAAERAGLKVGDQIRAIDGRRAGALSLAQALRLLRGKPGTSVRVGVLHVHEEFRRDVVDLLRAARVSAPFEVRVERGVGVVQLRDVGRSDAGTLAEKLDELRQGGATHLLLDLRNAADIEPRRAAPLASLFASGTLLRLRDRGGQVVDSLAVTGPAAAWSGPLALLVNGATAGSAEALAFALRSARQAQVLGESTYGLAAQPRLYELEGGAGMLLSARLWETPGGATWNDSGIDPDVKIEGKGDDPATRAADQLARVIDRLLEPSAPAAAVAKPAA